MLSIDKKKNKKNIKKSLLILSGVAVFVLVAGAAGWFFIYAHQVPPQIVTQPVGSIDYGPPTDAQKKEAEEQKDAILKNNDATGQPTGEPQQNSSDFTINITRAGQASAGQPVAVRALITGVNSGTCTFTFTKNGQPSITKTSNIAYEATTSTCGTDVSISEFGQTGEWRLTAKAVYSGKSVAAPEQTVVVK